MKLALFLPMAVAITCLQVSVTSAQSNLITLSETTLDFGCVEVGVGGKIDCITITNNTTSPIGIEIVNDGTSDFSPPLFGETIPGKDPSQPDINSTDFTIVFDPQSNGDASDVMTIKIRDSVGNLLGEETFTVVGTGGTACNPADLVDAILTLFDESIADGSLTGVGSGFRAHLRVRAMRNRIRAIDYLIQEDYLDWAAFITRTALYRTDGVGRDFVEGPASQDLFDQLDFLLFLLEN